MQQVVDDHRLVDVELQVPLACGKAYGNVVAHDLAGDHRQRLALGRVDLAGHDRAAWLVGWQAHFGQPRTRAGAEQAQVVGQFHQGHGQGLEGAGQGGQGFVPGQRGKFVRCGDEGQPGQRRQFSGHGLAETVG
ncbi:hypothetical protein D9M71_476410 [compost metagenome]